MWLVLGIFSGGAIEGWSVSAMNRSLTSLSEQAYVDCVTGMKSVDSFVRHVIYYFMCACVLLSVVITQVAVEAV